MTDDRELAYRICGLTAGLVALIALAGWSLAGAAQAAGALVGGASLKAHDFLGIVRASLEAKGRAGAPARQPS